jgi:hypothetical protein
MAEAAGNNSDSRAICAVQPADLHKDMAELPDGGRARHGPTVAAKLHSMLALHSKLPRTPADEVQLKVLQADLKALRMRRVLNAMMEVQRLAPEAFMGLKHGVTGIFCGDPMHIVSLGVILRMLNQLLLALRGRASPAAQLLNARTARIQPTTLAHGAVPTFPAGYFYAKMKTAKMNEQAVIYVLGAVDSDANIFQDRATKLNWVSTLEDLALLVMIMHEHPHHCRAHRVGACRHPRALTPARAADARCGW